MFNNRFPDNITYIEEKNEVLISSYYDDDHDEPGEGMNSLLHEYKKRYPDNPLIIRSVGFGNGGSGDCDITLELTPTLQEFLENVDLPLYIGNGEDEDEDE